jgi:hypothetical protein
MRGRTDAGIRIRSLLFILRDILEHALEVFRFEVRARNQRHRCVGDEADRLEVGFHVIGELAVERRRGRHADVVQKNRVAIRGPFRDLSRGAGAAGAGEVFDDDLLAERLAHRFSDQTADRVGRATGRERDDHRNITGGVVLRRSAGNAERENTRGGEKPLTHSSSSQRRARLEMRPLFSLQPRHHRG